MLKRTSQHPLCDSHRSCLNIHMYIYMCMCIHIYVYEYIYVCVYIDKNIHIYVYKKKNVYIYIYIYTHIYMYIFRYVYIYIYTYICKYIYICVCVRSECIRRTIQHGKLVDNFSPASDVTSLKTPSRHVPTRPLSNFTIVFPVKSAEECLFGFYGEHNSKIRKGSCRDVT